MSIDDDDDLPQGMPPPPGGSARDSTPPGEGEGERKRLFERAIPDVVKRMVERAVESGVERLAEGPENLKNLVGGGKIPKEVLHYLYTQIDETKNGIYRAVAKEIRDVLEQTHFAEEITKVLTKLSFEIKTEIRFIPNDAAVRSKDDAEEGAPGSEGGSDPTRLPKPEVKAQVSVRDRSRDLRRARRRREGQ